MKKRKTYFWAAAGTAFLLCLAQPEMVQASQEAKKLPQIVQWENGSGLDAEGTMLKDTWAYDMVNPAGRYVLFGEAGEVLKKQESIDNTEELDYTATETDFGKLGFRCTPFASFQGTVTVTMKEESGRTTVCELAPSNYYEANIPVKSGSYTLQSAEAKWEGRNYLIEVTEDAFEVGKDSMILVNMRVTETVLSRQEENSESGEREFTAGKNTQADKNKGMDEEVREEIEKEGRQPFFFWGIVFAIGMLGCLIYKKKHGKYA